MKKLLWLLVTVLLVLAGIVFSGPYVTVHGLSRAIERACPAAFTGFGWRVLLCGRSSP